MAHYAKVEDGVVTNVIVAESDHIDTLEGTWVKTSYNMWGGVYYEPNTNTPASDQSVITGDEARERKNFASIGSLYDGTGFYAASPFDSWTFNSTSYLWEPPEPWPEEQGLEEPERYMWNDIDEEWQKLLPWV